MKKLIALLLAAVLCLSLAACSGKSGNGAADGEDSSLTAEQQLIVDAVKTRFSLRNLQNGRRFTRMRWVATPKRPK